MHRVGAAEMLPAAPWRRDIVVGESCLFCSIRKGASGQGESCGEIAWLIADGEGRRGEGGAIEGKRWWVTFVRSEALS